MAPVNTSPIRGSLPIVQISCKHIPFLALLDTGADLNLIPKETFMRLSNQCKLKSQAHTSIKCTSATGEQVNLSGHIQLSFHLGGHFFSANFYIAGVSHIILGIPFFKRYNITIAVSPKEMIVTSNNTHKKGLNYRVKFENAEGSEGTNRAYTVGLPVSKTTGTTDGVTRPSPSSPPICPSNFNSLQYVLVCVGM